MSTFAGYPSASRAIVTLTDWAVSDGGADLRWQLRDLVLDGVREVVVDISEIEALSSTTLASLLATHRACRERGGGVVIRYPNRSAMSMLRRTGLDRVFRVERLTVHDADAGHDTGA